MTRHDKIGAKSHQGVLRCRQKHESTSKMAILCSWQIRTQKSFFSLLPEDWAWNWPRNLIKTLFFDPTLSVFPRFRRENRLITHHDYSHFSLLPLDVRCTNKEKNVSLCWYYHWTLELPTGYTVITAKPLYTNMRAPPIRRHASLKWLVDCRVKVHFLYIPTLLLAIIS